MKLKTTLLKILEYKLQTPVSSFFSASYRKTKTNPQTAEAREDEENSKETHSPYSMPAWFSYVDGLKYYHHHHNADV